MTRIRSSGLPARDAGLSMRGLDLEQRARPRTALEPQPASQRLGALLHARETVVPVLANDRRVEAATVVLHSKCDAALGVHQLHSNRGRPCVANGVRHGLTSDGE